MRELDFIEIIKNTLADNSYIGDDCAYLSDIGIVITHDSLVEDIHFSVKFSTPYMLGYKSVMVNLSDIFASGALPKYLTISLSLPKAINIDFVSEFYRACNELSEKFNFKIVGGDITGSDKIYLSICAIGLTNGRNISSRENAKVGDYVVVTGNHGSSAAGLWLLKNDVEGFDDIKNTHLMPMPNNELSNEVATKTDRDYSMMDTSDGLVDAIFKIAQASKVSIDADFENIPYDTEIVKIAKMANLDYKDWILFGGEDYQLVACLDEGSLSKINSDYKIIGRVVEKNPEYIVGVKFEDSILKINDLEKTYNHF